jgi:phenylalanyl-tRNA synthetase beta chain
VRAPLSWLRDFAPFGDDVAHLTATLDDIGLVVEGLERVGEGLDAVVVAEVLDIAPIAGADRIRRVVVEAGDGPVEIVCGAANFAVGDRVPLAVVGAVLPGGFEIARRTLRGVTSNGMLCSGRELGLSDDGEGLLVLTGVDGAEPGLPLAEVLGVERDVVFDLTVEGNRPDAWCMAGVARHLAARLGLPFSLPEPAPALAPGPPVGELASVRLDAPDLCPRITLRVLEGVRVGPSPRWLARRLSLAGMRPINNVVDASNYVMLERGQPTHPYDRLRLGGSGLVVRPARRGETLETLDGVRRTLGGRPAGRGTDGGDCVIADAHDEPVGVAGVIGGASSEITEATSSVLLETAYFAPMAIARTSRWLGVRTEASARFERGVDPWGLDAAAARFCELVALSAPGATLAEGTLEATGTVPEPFAVAVDLAKVNGLLGTALGPDQVGALLEPLGFGCTPVGAGVAVTVPTSRPDVRRGSHGVADVVEEVARAYGYDRLPRRQPSWPAPGGLSAYQRSRRAAREALVGAGAGEVMTGSLVAADDHRRVGLDGRAVEVANPLVSDEAFLRRSLMPGLLRALAWNVDRRQGEVRLFEVGVVFDHPADGGARVVERSGSGGAVRTELPAEHERLAALLALADDDARSAVGAYGVVVEALRLGPLALAAPGNGGGRGVPPGLHPTRSAWVVAPGGPVVGAVGEIDPAVAGGFGLPTARIGWVELDLGLVLDPVVVPRRTESVRPVSRFPSSDVDLALVVPDPVPAARVLETLRAAGGDLLESVDLFDVFRGPSLGAGVRSLAFRLRFCALDRTLTDAEVGSLRTACIEAVAPLGAVLR